MPGVRKRGEDIRDFLLNNITENRNFAVLTSQQFGISLPAVYKHIDRLAAENKIIKKTGRYLIKSKQYKYAYNNDGTLSEDSVWEKDIKKHFINAAQNIWRMWTYGFLEMFNNAIEHSKGKKINIIVSENKIYTAVAISDDGIGIFNNIKANFNLLDEKDALLELVKGKRTTDTKRHSGQGIFFTSKMFDNFFIKSNGITFNSMPEKECALDITKQKYSTWVYMRLYNNSVKTPKDIFDEFSTEIPGDFDKTIVPIYFVNSTDLVSRSQARRVLSGLELFKEVTLDFKNIEYIGQAFADEIFRVFRNMNPGTAISAINTNDEVLYMINRTIKTK